MKMLRHQLNTEHFNFRCEITDAAHMGINGMTKLR